MPMSRGGDGSLNDDTSDESGGGGGGLVDEEVHDTCLREARRRGWGMSMDGAVVEWSGKRKKINKKSAWTDQWCIWWWMRRRMIIG